MSSWLRMYARLLAMAVVLGSAVAVSYFFLLEPARERSESIGEEMSEIESQLDRAGRQAASSATDILSLSQEGRGEPASETGDQPEIVGLLERRQAAMVARRLAHLAESSGLGVHTLGISPEQFFRETSTAAEHPLHLMVVELHSRGTYGEVGSFLKRLACYPLPNRVLWLAAERARTRGLLETVVSVGVPLSSSPGDEASHSGETSPSGPASAADSRGAASATAAVGRRTARSEGD